jgi:hypothetical protein
VFSKILSRRRGFVTVPEGRRSHQAQAACTAWVWLALYGVATTSSLVWGPRQHQAESLVVPAAPAILANLK